VFWGVIDRRMDVGFVRQLAADLGGSVALVGPQDEPDPELRRLDGVVLLPPVPFADLPRLAAAADVLVMPYADLPVTRAMQPLKLKEYLATGKPVVVRDLPATRDWGDSLDLASSAREFAEKVGRRLREGVPARQRQARERLCSEGWDEKARWFAEWACSPEGEQHRERGEREQSELVHA
jgi:glycosyltransferase involved in cell wall biosynthesis